MQKVRQSPDLLNRAINNAAGLSPRLLLRLSRLLQKQLIQYHLSHGEFLPQSVVQVTRDTAALLILRRHEADRKTPQFVRAPIDHLFQFDGVVTNRLFQHLTVVNIGAGAIPLNDLPLGISNRKSTRAEPTVGAIFRAQTILRFITSPHFNGVYPNRLTALNVVGVYMVEPTDTLARVF